MGISDLVVLKLFLSKTFYSSKLLLSHFGTKWSRKIIISNNNVQIIRINIFYIIRTMYFKIRLVVLNLNPKFRMLCSLFVDEVKVMKLNIKIKPQ